MQKQIEIANIEINLLQQKQQCKQKEHKIKITVFKY